MNMNILSGFWEILTLVGALGLFLFGMKTMSEALQKVAGNKMRNILSAMTNNRLKGVFTGMLVTTTIQSSSATTVMVVSFVNAGLLTLIGAIGVIMGANIGTTVTAWIISIVGFKISMSILSLPLIGLSFPLFFSKNNHRKSWGEFLIGFAILFIGLQFLKDSVPDINSHPEILNFLSSYTDLGFISILLFVLIGTILTIIIQSSSAIMALTLVLCYNGILPFEIAAAMVLGENIGTTITANLAAIVANVSSKRAARAHFLFNAFGVFWILLIFRFFLNIIDQIVKHQHGVSILETGLTNEEFESVKSLYPIALSLFHTIFNISNTFILIWFAPLIAKIATKMVPFKDDEEFRLKYINTSMLSISELSTLQAKKEIVLLGKRVEKMFTFIPILLSDLKNKDYDKLLKKIAKFEQITDNMEIEIAQYLTEVAVNEMSHKGSAIIRAMLKIIDDLESVADEIFQVSRVIDNKNQMKVEFNDEQKKSLSEIFKIIEKAFSEMNNNLEKDYNYVDCTLALEIEEEINVKRNELRQKHIDDLKEKKYKHNIGAFYSDVFSLSEKVGDYVINITEAIDEYQKS